MGIQINGATDSITAIDGTIDVVSAIGNAGVVTATAFVGNITGNVTGNINHASNLELQVGGVTRANINSSGRMLLNTTTAGYSTADDLTIATSGSTGITLRSGTTNQGNIYFADGTSGASQYAGLISYNHNTNHMFFGTNDGTERFRINSTGQIITNGGSANPYPTRAATFQPPSGQTNCYVSIISGSTSGASGLTFGDGADNNAANYAGMFEYRHNGDTLAYMQNGSDRLRIASDGDLTIVGNDNAELKLLCGSSSGNDIIAFQNSSGATRGNITYDSDNNFLLFNVNQGERLRITSAGNVGIGTDNPDASYGTNLSVHSTGGNTGARIKLSDGTSGTGNVDGFDLLGINGRAYVINRENHEMYFSTNNTVRMRINGGGQVNIGNNITQTSKQFYVDGTAEFTGDVSIGNTITSSQAIITGTTTAVRNSGVSTATGSIIYNSSFNALEVYTGSIWKVIQTKLSNIGISYLVVGGGAAGGGYYRGGGGGAGALRTNWNNESQGGGQSSAAAKTIIIGTAFSIIVGAGGAGAYNANGNPGGTTTFDDIVSNGGTGGARYTTAAPTNSGNGSGGGGGGHTGVTHAGGAGGTYGYAGGAGSGTSNQCGGGGGGAAAVGQPGGNGGTDGDGGAALANTITGSSVDYAGGAGGGNYGNGNVTIGGGAGAQGGGVGAGGAPGINASIANRGSGGSGAGGDNVSGGNGSAGVIILRFSSFYTATVTGGVTSSTASVGSDTVLTITATSDSSQTVTFS